MNGRCGSANSPFPSIVGAALSKTVASKVVDWLTTRKTLPAGSPITGKDAFILFNNVDESNLEDIVLPYPNRSNLTLGTDRIVSVVLKADLVSPGDCCNRQSNVPYSSLHINKLVSELVRINFMAQLNSPTIIDNVECFYPFKGYPLENGTTLTVPQIMDYISLVITELVPSFGQQKKIYFAVGYEIATQPTSCQGSMGQTIIPKSF
jgi:hypothetical protein